VIPLRKDPKLEGPGKWKEAEGRKTATITCPKCAAKFSLANFEILSSGKVIVSVVCPFYCGWWDFIRLEGWDGGYSNPRKRR
jgi:hypothetical protein